MKLWNWHLSFAFQQGRIWRDKSHSCGILATYEPGGIVFVEYGLTGMGGSQTVDENFLDMDVADQLYFTQTPRLLS